MWVTNLKVVMVVLGTIVFFTMLANAIPQVESDVPRELVLTADMTADELVEAGEQLFFGAGACSACHGTGERAPNLLTDEAGTGAIGARCAARVPGMDCKEYLYLSLVEPNQHPVPGYAPIMPSARRTLSEAQIWALVAFLESHGGEVTVTPADVGTADDAPTTPAPAAVPGSPAAATATPSLDPLVLLREHQCLVCHQLAGEGAPIGPPFDGIGARRSADELRTKIIDPVGAGVTPGYEAVAGVMPTNFGTLMTGAQLEVMVRYLAGLR